MNKQFMGKPGGNFPAPQKATSNSTATPVRPVPLAAASAAASVPSATAWNPGYPTTGPAGTNPLTNGSDSMNLPMFNPAGGFSDSGVGHSGDTGGAG